MPWYSKDRKVLQKHCNGLTNKRLLSTLQQIAVDLYKMDQGILDISEGAFYELDTFREIVEETILRRITRKRRRRH